MAGVRQPIEEVSGWGMGSDWLVCIWKVPPTPGRLLLVWVGKVEGALQGRQAETRWLRQITGLSGYGLFSLNT